ncbi:hypothetical protein SSTU70S_04245 [Stutzerimonas stutzeri]
MQDKRAGKRYRVVGELAGMTELEEIDGEPRYVQTLALKNKQLWVSGDLIAAQSDKNCRCNPRRARHCAR